MDYFSTVANAIDGAQVTNLVEKDFEKHSSVRVVTRYIFSSLIPYFYANF